MPADGGEARCLTEGKEGVDGIAWSPDSSRIAFVRRVRDEAYEEEDDAKRAPRRFRRLFYKLDGVGWTGDRRRHLFVVDLAGGEARQLTDGDCEDDEPTWTPDGTRIVFSALRGERWDTELVTRLYEVDADGGEPRPLTGDDGSYGSPTFSPDGSRIAYRFEPEDGTDPRHGQIGMMNADGTGARLLDDLARPAVPAVPARPASRSGTASASSSRSRTGGNVHLYAVAADGSSEPELARRRRALDRALRRSSPGGSRTRPRPPPSRWSSTRAPRREADERLGGLRRRPRARRARALHRRLGGRHRGRRVARPAGRLRGGQALSGAAHDPRRPVRAVRHRLLRRGPGLRGRRLRGALREPARRLRPLGGVGACDPRPDRRAGAGLGHGRLRRPDGRRRHGARALRLPRPRADGRPRRLVRRLHDLLDRRPHEPLQGRALGARRQPPRQRIRLERPLLGVRAPVRRADDRATSRRGSPCRRPATRRTSPRRS